MEMNICIQKTEIPEGMIKGKKKDSNRKRPHNRNFPKELNKHNVPTDDDVENTKGTN